jgi:hypothetical protein
MLFLGFPGLQELDFMYDFPMKDQEHITDHAEHENFNAHYNKEHGKNCQGNVINSLQPFMQNIHAGENSEK